MQGTGRTAEAGDVSSTNMVRGPGIIFVAVPGAAARIAANVQASAQVRLGITSPCVGCSVNPNATIPVDTLEFFKPLGLSACSVDQSAFGFATPAHSVLPRLT